MNMKVEYIIDNLLFKGERLVIAGQPGASKSTFVTQLAIALATGGEYGDLPGNPTCKKLNRIYLFDGENNEHVMQMRYHALPEFHNLHRITDCDCFGTYIDLLEYIYGIVTTEHTDIVIILDNLTSLLPPILPDEARTFMRGLEKIAGIAERLGYSVTYIVVTHTVKNFNLKELSESSVSGPTNICRFADRIDIMCVPTPREVAIYNIKCRNGVADMVPILIPTLEPYLHLVPSKSIPISKWKSYVGQKESFSEPATTEEKPKRKVTEEVRERVFELNKNGLSYQQIIETLVAEKLADISKQTVGNIINGKA